MFYREFVTLILIFEIIIFVSSQNPIANLNGKDSSTNDSIDDASTTTIDIESTITPTKFYDEDKNSSLQAVTMSEEFLPDRPTSCSLINREKLEIQPVRTSESRIKKCCLEGENFYNLEGSQRYCDVENHTFKPEVINVVLYDNCIEDTQEKIELDIIAGNPCNVSFTYSAWTDDQLYVLQDGSLLILDGNGNQSNEITNEYCLDTDAETGELLAIVCYTSINAHISQGQTVLFAVFMFVSIPCLILVTYIHFAIKELRTVHGLSLGMLSASLAIGFSLHIYVQIFAEHQTKVGYSVQYFMLSYFFWMLMLCVNAVITVWYYLPRYVTINRCIRYGRLAAYSFIAFTIPLILVLITYSKKLPGMPSYYYQGWSESVQTSQKYFIPPVSGCIIISFLLLVVTYFGFRRLNNIVNDITKAEYNLLRKNQERLLQQQQQQQRIYFRQNTIISTSTVPILDEGFLKETKKDAKCISILLLIIASTWILEVVTFYSPGSGDHLAFMEILNGLQGVFILMIFVVGRDRRYIIKRWWHDRGTHYVTPVPPPDVEMTDMGTKNKTGV